MQHCLLCNIISGMNENVPGKQNYVMQIYCGAKILIMKILAFDTFLDAEKLLSKLSLTHLLFKYFNKSSMLFKLKAKQFNCNPKRSRKRK